MAKTTRRHFTRQAALAGAYLSAMPIRAFRSQPPSSTVVLAVMGVRSRGRGLARELARMPGVAVGTVCDVDRRFLDRCAEEVARLQGREPRREKDIRKVLEDPAIDGVVIAAPDHWHAPASILAVDAGKHVYVEKPCGHDPREGELLVAAQRRTGKIIHMGNQRRSWPGVIRCIEALRAGVIGKVYYAKTWYANNRGPIGHGKEAAVPAELDWELWQGPAPRTPYRDNVHPYNWHWFWRWGTGEALNNATHELDVARWGLGVDYPIRVTASGGRYAFDDDWEFPDTMNLALEFEGGRAISWEGRSCNNHPIEGMGRGVVFHGAEGTVTQLHNGYVAYANDAARTVIERLGGDEARSSDATNTASPDASLDGVHLASFTTGIRDGVPTSSPIDEGHKSVLLGHLGNIAWKVGRVLEIDPTNGRIRGDAEAAAMWGREYEPGWEPRA